MAVAELTNVGTLLADETRATVLVALMDGRARTAGELARHAHVAPSTISGHLARLLEGGFLAVATQGRHRYYRIADPAISQLLETVGGLTVPDTRDMPAMGNAPTELRYVRTCYDHLAGQLAVSVHDRLLADGHVERTDGTLVLTSRGRRLLRTLGVETWNADEHRPALRPCLDWTERRDHLAGPAAAALFATLLDRRWLARGSRPRSLRVTELGRRGLGDSLGV